MKTITAALIQSFIAENNIEYCCTQTKLCVPVINRICRKMFIGIRFAEIKIDNKFICDGHHRYLASLLAGYSLHTIPSARTSATKMVNWKTVYFDTEDWDTPAKIRVLDEQDAEYNDIPVDEPVALLK